MCAKLANSAISASIWSGEFMATETCSAVFAAVWHDCSNDRISAFLTISLTTPKCVLLLYTFFSGTSIRHRKEQSIAELAAAAQAHAHLGKNLSFFYLFQI